MTSLSDANFVPFKYFSVEGKNGSLTGLDLWNRVGDVKVQTRFSQIFALSYVLCEMTYCLAKTKHLLKVFRAFFLLIFVSIGLIRKYNNQH